MDEAVSEKWKTDYPQEAADLEWWEAGFGKGNVLGWTYRNTAKVKLAGKLRDADPELRKWMIENAPHIGAQQNEGAPER